MAQSPAKRLRRTLARAGRAEIRSFWRERPITRNVVFLESFDGNGALCNPEAIFRALIADPEFASLRFVWSLRAGHPLDLVLAEFRGDRRVTFVEPGSSAYARFVSTAGYLVTNSTFPRWFSRRAGQTVVNTWHGTPLKKMGFDIDDQPSRVANVMRNFLHADILLSSGPYMTETMYRRAHRLDGLFEGRILEVGSPRVDSQFGGPETMSRIHRQLAEAGLDTGGRQFVLFAPTWKGVSFLRPVDDAALLLEQARGLQERLGDAYRVALKVHQAVHDSLPEGAGTGLVVPNDLPTNAVLAITDHLVTDYSSIFFDFLATERPIHFFTPDLGDYDGYRGLYLDPAVWPGRVTTTVADLADSIRSAGNDAMVATVSDARRRFAPDEDGEATGRVVDAVFRRRFDDARVRRLNSVTRPRLLLVAGGPPGPWNSSDVADEIHRTDLDRTDVTVLVSDSRGPDFIAWQRDLDDRIRIVVRQGGLGGSKIWTPLARVTGRRPASHWRDEWLRLFGVSRFDTVTLLTRDAFWSALVRFGAERSRPPGAHS